MRTSDHAPDLGEAFRVSPNAYLVVTPDLRMAEMNQAFLDMVRRKRAELIGKLVFSTFDGGPAEDASENARRLRASFEGVFATGRRNDIAVLHYAIPTVGRNGGFSENYWTITHTPILGVSGVDYVLHHAIDISEIEQLRRKTAERSRLDGSPPPLSALDAIVGGAVLDRARLVQDDNRRLENERIRLVDMFMQAPGFVAVLSGPTHVIQMHNEAYAALIGRQNVLGRTVAETLPELDGQGFYELLDHVFTTGTPHEGRDATVTFQATPTSAAQEQFVNFIYQPIRSAKGEVVGIFVQGHDVTDMVRAAERQKLMIDELNHRVKNTLATVQSIAVQTARSNADPARFAESFQARLMALSHTHDLLTRSHWQGADLREILTHETDVHGANRVVLNGPSVSLDPAASLSLGMIFHELATNAAKYGALSVGEGRVFVDWAVTRDERPRLSLRWRERGGPPVVEPERRGFGSRLIERNVHHDLAGEVKLGYATDGFSAEISAPLDRGRPS